MIVFIKKHCKYFCEYNPRKIVSFTLYMYDNKAVNIKCDVGTNLFDCVKANGFEIKTECNKNMQCGECHCVLSDGIINDENYIKPDEEENDKSYILYPLYENSRFSCKTIINESFQNKDVYLINNNL